MSFHIIIDGYNLIRQSCTLGAFDQKDLQLGREVLLDKLAAYKKIKHHKITVVFDAANVFSFLQQRDYIKGIEIKFSRQGELADAVIKRMAARETEKALVVTSDRDIVNFAQSQGATTISSSEFERKITMAEYFALTGACMDDEEETGWKPTTKKKGPGKRLSKKDRKNRIKIKKL